MNEQIKITQNVYQEGLKAYIKKGQDYLLSEAYEISRKLVGDGFSELTMIAMHHEALEAIINGDPMALSPEQLDRASVYLREWIAPFELKLQSYRALVKELNEKNSRLETEIKNRREIQQELVSSKEYFQTLIENGQDIITVLDKNGVIRYNSPSVERILNYKTDELLGSDLFKYIHNDDLENIKNLFRSVTDAPNKVASAEFRFLNKAGNWVYLESIAKHVENSRDGPIIVINSRDITERIFTLQKMRENKAKLAEAQSIAKVGSWEWYPGREPELEWSDEMCRIYGFQPVEFDNSYENFINHVHPDDRERVEKTVELALRNKNNFSFEHKIIRTDGEVRTLFGRGRVITNGNDKVIKMIGTGQDITEQKEKEDKLRRYSKRLRKLSERVARSREEERVRIAREIHDELGQMLTVLKMDVSMMSGQMKKKVSGGLLEYFNEEATKILDRINTIIKSVQRITTELRPEVLDDLGLIEALKWQASELEKRAELEINFLTNLSDTDFLNDEKSTTVFRVFQEAMNNIMRHANASKVNINLDKYLYHFVLSIRDDGVGISKGVKDSGSCYGIIGMRERTRFLGGDVFLESKEQEGTHVTVWIPIVEKTKT